MMKARHRRFFWCDSQLDSSTVVHKQRQIVALFRAAGATSSNRSEGKHGKHCHAASLSGLRITSRFQPQRLSLVPDAAGCKPS